MSGKYNIYSILIIISLSGCMGTGYTRSESVNKGNSAFGAYPYMAVAADAELIFSQKNEFTKGNGIFGLLSLPFDICLDTLLLPVDVSLWPFGFKKDPYKVNPQITKNVLDYDAKMSELYQMLIQDSNIALSQKWFVRPNSERISLNYTQNQFAYSLAYNQINKNDVDIYLKRFVFIDSLRNNSVQYSVETLDEIFQESNEPYIFLSQSCTGSFLSRHFNNALTDTKNYNHEHLNAIIENNNTPYIIYKLAAESSILPKRTVEIARERLLSSSGQ